MNRIESIFFQESRQFLSNSLDLSLSASDCRRVDEHMEKQLAELDPLLADGLRIGTWIVTFLALPIVILGALRGRPRLTWALGVLRGLKLPGVSKVFMFFDGLVILKLMEVYAAKRSF